MRIQSAFLAVATIGCWLAQPAVAHPPASATGSPELSYYLPSGVAYDPAIPLPSAVLGFEVGERHVRHDQLVAYLQELARSSPRVELTTTGTTYEKRSLLLLTLSSPANLARLDELRRQHLALADPREKRPDVSDMPVVVYLGYSVHGNEASGSNASLLVAYHLAAALDPRVDELLENTIVLLDPALNPDGLGRFAEWANMHRGRVLVADNDHREHREGWPNGRTNHYWFDLNRDYLPAQHPESQARLAQFHRWKPNVLADFHEMGTDETYFFQPGVPSRAHPLTPARNVELTQAIARFHARALDSVGSLYFSEETFDDFYYGKGSTYPDVNGGVGILFEQASARGHLQESADGFVSFPFAIRNHFLTSMSTLEGALANRQELLAYQADFFRQPPTGDIAGWIFGDAHDPARLFSFLEVLRRHRIEVRPVTREINIGARRFQPGSAYVVKLDQPQRRLLRALFERRTDFADPIFYDISTWTLPLAFGLDHAELPRGEVAAASLGEPVDEPVFPAGRFAPRPDAYAYAFAWDGYYAPRALYRLLTAGIKARVATQPFSTETGGRTQRFERGTIVLPLGIQTVEPARLEELLRQAATSDAVEILSLSTGLTSDGVDLGSPSLRALEAPKMALVVGEPVSTYEAGEIWHLLDQRFAMELTLLDANRLERSDLASYTHLILVDGDYGDLSAKAVDALRRFVRQGGTLITAQGAVPWADRNLFPAHLAREKPADGEPGGGRPDAGLPTHTAITEGPRGDDDTVPARRPYGEMETDRAVKLISGAIFEVELDLTHPLAFGYRQPRLPVFRNNQIFFAAEKDPYVTVAAYTDEPLLSGYVSSDNLSQLAGTPELTAHRLGDGAVVRMADDLSFRAFWYGTQKLFLNAIFFAPILERGER